MVTILRPLQPASSGTLTQTQPAGSLDGVEYGWQIYRQLTQAGTTDPGGPLVVKGLASTVITSETTVWTPTSGKKFNLMGWTLTQGVVTGNITLKDNTGGTTIFVIPLTTIGISNTFILPRPILSAAVNNVLTATGVSTETITGSFFGTEE